MRSVRRNRGLERAGRLPSDQLGLGRARGRELLLETAWRRVAGEAIARRATVRRVARGVLEIEVDDEAWLESVRSLIPRLAGRLTTACPELGIKRFRLQRGDGSRERAVAVATEPDEPRESRPAPAARRPAAVSTPSGGVDAARLVRAMERYLERGRRR